MHKTDKITFNVNDLQRKHTGQKRCYDNIGLARLINSPTIQERVKKGDLIGFYGHWIRKKFGMQPKEGAIDPETGKAVIFNPAIRTTYLAADDKGNITHQTQFLDTPEGETTFNLHQNKVGGFSTALTAVPKGFTEIPTKFYGFDYVIEPNFSGNRGYTLRFDSVPDDPAVLERFDSIPDEGDIGELIHCFDSVEAEIIYQGQVMTDLYRGLQQDYVHVLDTVGAMQGQLSRFGHQAVKSSRSPIFIDEQKIARFDSANEFLTADLAALEIIDDDYVAKEKAKIDRTIRRYRS